MLRWFCCSVVLLAVFALQTDAQNSRSPDNSPGPGSPHTIYPPPEISSQDAPASEFERQARTKQNEDRQIAMKRDADRLFAMASDLKQNVDRTNGNILSVDVIKKAQEIEKLAKSVREKMKGQ